MACVTRELPLAERTARRWRQQAAASEPALRGRPPRCATRADRNEVARFLERHGSATPLVAVRSAFPQLARFDLSDVCRRFKQLQRRQAESRCSWLEWLRPGTVWAADFKERREPLEGRYFWILSIKDLASRAQLLWQPLESATAAGVQLQYEALFLKYGPPLVMKSDNGGQFRADETKDLLAQYQVVPLFSPKRHPQYNGGVERANGQLTSYQEAAARYRKRPAGPTCEDAATALAWANQLTRPHGWQGPTADELWQTRASLVPVERAAFLEAVEQQRRLVRAQFDFAHDALLTHHQQAAVDRRAVRDVLVAHDLLRIHPRRKSGARKNRVASSPVMATQLGAGIITLAETPVAALNSRPLDQPTHFALAVNQQTQEAHSSTNKSNASGQN